MDYSQDKVARVTVGREASTGVPGTGVVGRAAPATVYVVNAKHRGKPDRAPAHVLLTKDGLRWSEAADRIGKERKGKCW